MFDTLVVLNLQYFKRESYISVICQAIDIAVEGRKADADTHLAGARSQNTGTGILGNIQKIKDSRFYGCLFSSIVRHSQGAIIIGADAGSSLRMLWQIFDVLRKNDRKETGLRRRNKKHYSIYIAWILLLLCVIAGMKAGIEEGVGGKTHEYPGISVQSRLEDLWKMVSEKKEDRKMSQENSAEENGAGEQKQIRVLIMTDGYKQIVHKEFQISAAGGLIVEKNGTQEEIAGNEILTITKADSGFQNGKIRVSAKNGGEMTAHSIGRGYGNPSYTGILDLYATSEGIVIINELPVENYLCKVVPSEMPASYQKEALKAQAVCARNYAYRQMEDYAYPEYQAHVNDSTDYQVYNNSAQQEASTEAVRDTSGEILKYNGNVVTTYYYSTSCGKTTTMKAWGTSENEENGYLRSVEVRDKDGDYEKTLPWYRWEADIDQDTLCVLLAENVKKNIGTVRSLQVMKTGPGGVVMQIKAEGDKGSVTVDTENKIRKALGGNGYEIKKQDGTTVKSGTLLPSAFFTVEKSGNMFKIKGGGYGHGIGMSQNGANEMAKKGKNYQEILQMFYPGTTIEK